MGVLSSVGKGVAKPITGTAGLIRRNPISSAVIGGTGIFAAGAVERTVNKPKIEYYRTIS